MSDDIKSAVLSEGDASARRDNENLEGFPPAEGNVETPSRTATPSPDIEADAEADPQAPNRKGQG